MARAIRPVQAVLSADDVTTPAGALRSYRDAFPSAVVASSSGLRQGVSRCMTELDLHSPGNLLVGDRLVIEAASFVTASLLFEETGGTAVDGRYC